MDLMSIATEIIANQMVLVDFEGEAVCLINRIATLQVVPHYVDKDFYGYNLYARLDYEDGLRLLETYGSYSEALEVKESIEEAFSSGINYYELPVSEDD